MLVAPSPAAAPSAREASHRASSQGGGGDRRRSLQAPGSRGPLEPNDDAREKDQARRRRSVAGEAAAAAAPPAKRPEAPALSPAAIAALYQNCLKLASENKITAKNTWALPLIDHLSDLVLASDARCDGGDDGGDESQSRGTDFQRASLTLAAGVSIYAHRVDAVHGDVFRILGGLGRGGLDDDENEENGEGGNGNGRGGANNRRNARRRNNGNHADADPSSSTLDSLENINAKKFDLAFAVDPLFQRTAALFDEGGAAGLLLNSLPLLGGPALAFDSAAVPCAVDAGALGAGTVGGGRARLPPGCLGVEAAAALGALEDPSASRPCPAQLALAEAAGKAVLPPGDDGGARELVAGVVAEIEAAEKMRKRERKSGGDGVEEVEVAEEEDDDEAGSDGNEGDAGEAAHAAAGGGWPELERAMAAADRAAAGAEAAPPAPAVVAAVAAVAVASSLAPVAAAEAAADPLSSSPAAAAAALDDQQQRAMSADDDDDLGGGFDDDDGLEEEEEVGAAQAAAAASDSSPVLGGNAAAAAAPAWIQNDDGPSPMTPGTPASPAVVDNGDDNNAHPPFSSRETPPAARGNNNNGIARAVSHVGDEPPPTHAKAWAGAAHWRHRAARAARAGLFGENENEDDGDENGNGENTAIPLGGMFGAPTPLQNRRHPGGAALTSSDSVPLNNSNARPDAIDFANLPPLDPKALAKAPARLTTLRAIRAKAETLLPDDVHFSPQALSRLFDAPETTPAAAAAAAAEGAAAASRRRLLGVSEEREENLEEEEEDEEEMRGGLGGNDSDEDDEEEAAAASDAARAIAAAAVANASTAAAAAANAAPQQTAAAKAAETALLHSLALPDPNAPHENDNPFFSAAAAAGWGGTAPASGSAAAAAAAKAAAAANGRGGAAPMAYARVAKRVDVRALKVALWAEACEAAAEKKRGEETSSSSPLLFSELVSRVADGPRGRAAAPPGQLSPHLVFICLLHLCNEHSLELGRTSDGKGHLVLTTTTKLQPAVSLGGGADLTVSGVEVE